MESVINIVNLDDLVFWCDLVVEAGLSRLQAPGDLPPDQHPGPLSLQKVLSIDHKVLEAPGKVWVT